MKQFSKASGVVSTLYLATTPRRPPMTTTSVKVPPISMPMLSFSDDPLTLAFTVSSTPQGRHRQARPDSSCVLLLPSPFHRQDRSQGGPHDGPLGAHSRRHRQLVRATHR